MRPTVHGPVRSARALTLGAFVIGGFAIAAVGSDARAGSSPAHVYRDGPPPAHTGGFGEPTCRYCHASYDVNEGPGDVTVHGVPPEFTPGHTYTLRIALRHKGLRIGGFQLSARFEDGAKPGNQAGGFVPLDTLVAVTEHESILYAHHVRAGSFPAMPDSIQWSLAWTAPEQPIGSVVFHVAANAANDDNSEFEDLVYSAAVRARAGPGR